MLKHLVILVLVTFVCESHKHKLKPFKISSHHGRIVGGHEAAPGERPYQVSMILTDIAGETYLCGGSVLSSRWVLSAAHCFTNIRKVDVRAGSNDLFSGGTTASTTRFRVHPLYNHATNDYDIAVVDLRSNVLPLDGTKIKAVKLASASGSPSPGTPVTVSGWGTTQEGGSTSQTLMEVDVLTVNSTECKKSYPQLSSRMLCAGVKEGGKDSCQGDSGGPMVLASDNTQVGIVSFGVGCARAGVPGVYSNVAALRSWITSNTGI